MVMLTVLVNKVFIVVHRSIVLMSFTGIFLRSLKWLYITDAVIVQ